MAPAPQPLPRVAFRAFDTLLVKRASTFGRLLLPHLPDRGRALDVGSGTGHTSAFLLKESDLQVIECDVVDFSTHASHRPLRFDGVRLPFRDETFAATLLLFSLHYAEDPCALLRELRRVSRSCIVLHTTAATVADRWRLRFTEHLEGSLAFSLAQSLRLVPSTGFFPLRPRRYFTRAELDACIGRAGLVVHARESHPRMLPGLTFELRSLA